MNRRRLSCVVVGLVALTGIGSAQDEKPVPPPAVIPMVGTHYFYWYRHDDHHFLNPDGSDALIQHFERPESVDWAEPAWHRAQLDQMTEGGIDFVLPVYWGIPDKPGLHRWADEGLTALVRARQGIVEAGGAPPGIAMFFDTSTVLRSVRGEGPSGTLDLRTDEGKKIFADTILAFFRQVPPEHRFELDGFPVVVLYSSFGAPHDRDLLDHVDDRFLLEWKKRLYFIAEQSWNVRCHARYRWGAALSGPTGDTVVRVVGPGYDDTRVPGRGTPVRDREDTRFYQWSWQQALLAKPTLVLVETWNEFHEGTGIAPCVEFGDAYVQTTRRYVRRLKRGLMPAPDDFVRLASPDPQPRPDKGWYVGDADATSVNFVAAASTAAGHGSGLRVIDQADGLFRRVETSPRDVLRTETPKDGVSYLYLGIADEFSFRSLDAFEVEFDVIGSVGARIELQYDSWDRLSPQQGAYRSAPAHRFDDATGGTTTLTWTLPDARFSNRQNGAADFRLAVRGRSVDVAAVRVTRIAAPTSTKPSLTVR